MNDTDQRTAEFLAIVIENAELRQQLAEVQDQCVELAVDAGELHAEIEMLRARLAIARAVEDDHTVALGEFVDDPADQEVLEHGAIAVDEHQGLAAQGLRLCRCMDCP